MDNKKIKSIALFIPHLGCPHKCVFCNQNAIASQTKMPTRDDIKNAVERALMSRRGSELEIAFFGGSFTCIGDAQMKFYLDAAQELVDSYGLHGIRFSTRPDGIDERIMTLLRPYSVKVIELGAQSMTDTVLSACERGHTAACTARAVKLIKSEGIDVVLQMMTGLPGSDRRSDLETADRIINLEPSAVRVYPTLVFENTHLYEMLREGTYKPQTLDEAVDICCELLELFDEAGIPVIKLGLNADSDFKNTLKAGPYHPAFRELVENRQYLERIQKAISDKEGKYVVRFSSSLASKVIGHKGGNKKAIEELCGKDKVSFVCDNSAKLDIFEINKINY